jgi:hypothetical protein
VDPDGSPQALAVLNHIWAIYRGLPPKAVDSQTTASLNTLSQERNLRLLESEASLPRIFWPILAMGAVMTTVLGLLLHLHNGKVRVLTVALLAGTMALCLWLIVELNYPFTGEVSVAAAPFYEHAIYVIKSLPR